MQFQDTADNLLEVGLMVAVAAWGEVNDWAGSWVLLERSSTWKLVVSR